MPDSIWPFAALSIIFPLVDNDNNITPDSSASDVKQVQQLIQVPDIGDH